MSEVAQKRGIIYCRVSSKEQVENTSLESQERFCRDYAARNGIEVAKVFIERGESAKTADRPEIQAAIKYCLDKRQSIEVFIVHKLDRFARNQEDHMAMRALLTRAKVRLVSATEPITPNPIGRLLEGVLSATAEFDNSIRTERSTGGMIERLKQGIWVWAAPIGYYRPRSSSNIEPDPNTAYYIRLAFEEYAKGGYSFASLANFLTERGFRTRGGKKLYKQQVERILRNYLYCGIMKALGEEFEGRYESLINRELFEQCQNRSRGKAHIIVRKTENPEFPLRKLVMCSECGSSLTGSASKGRSAKYPYYHHHKQGCARAKFISKDSLEKLFVEYLTRITPNSRYEKLFKAIVLNIWQTNYKKMDESNARLRIEIEKLEQDRQKVFELHRKGVYSDEELIEQKDYTNQKIYEKRRLMLENHIEEFDMEQVLSFAFGLIRNTASAWQGLGKDFPRRVRFQNLVFEGKVSFDGEKFGTAKLSCIYRLNDEYLGSKTKLVPLGGIEPP